VKIRPIQDADWPQVHEIVVEVAAAGETYAMDVPTSVEETRAFWTGQHVVVAEDDGRILGSAKMGPNRTAQGAHVGTASFMVGSAARGRGVGRALAEHMVAWHREHGYRGIQFNAVVATNTSAVRLWESLGFETIGLVPGAFRLPAGGRDSGDRVQYVDLHVMYLSLVEG
jgi:L-amino acid N-acyltransferase YncA